MEELERFARELAARAGRSLRERWPNPRVVGRKSPVDLVTDADRASEELIVEAIARTFAGHDILAEESIEKTLSGSEYCWIIDPLDGTTNWVHGCPHIAVSIAVAHRGRVGVGVVYDPLRDEMFHAASGKGAQMNGLPIRPSTTGTLDDALLATGFPYDCRERAAFYLAFVQRLMGVSRGLRRFGSAALDLCYVACGRFDGYWEWSLNPWDTAAGALIVEEAAGNVTDFAGRLHDLFGGQTLASNGLIHGEMVSILQEVSGMQSDPRSR